MNPEMQTGSTTDSAATVEVGMLPSNRSRMTRTLGALVTGLLLVAAPALQAQQTGTVTGRVTDSQSGQPVASVQIFIAGLDIGVLTQQNGRFLLQNVPAGTHTVSAERIGYNTQTAEVSLGAGETVVQNFTLTEEALQLDEVIVTGTPGGTQRRAIGNSVSQVEAASVTQQVAITNMQDLLTARTPGLQFSRLSGNVGTGSPIQIRGVSSFQLSANPLIYVDGVRVNNSARAGPQLGASAAGQADDPGVGGVNVLDDFNPEDIESIEIIKGPAAATLYGTEASAGVIQIITKRGQEGDAQFSASIRQGTNFMTDPAGRLGQQYTCLSTPSPPCAGESDIVPYNMYEEANRYISGEVPYTPSGGATPLTEWPTNNLYQYGHSQGYNLDVRGGTSTIRYFLSGNYETEEGIVWYNTDETFRLRGNVSVVFSENWTLDVSTGYVDGFTRFAAPTVSDGGLWQDLRWSNGYFLERLNPGSNPRLGGFQEHLPTDVSDIEATRDYSRFTGSATLNFTYGDWLTQRAVVGIDKGWDENRNLFPLDPGQAVYSETSEGQITYARPINDNFSVDYAATADYDINEAIGTSTSVGFQYYIESRNEFSNTGIGFPSPLSTTVNQTPAARATIDYDYRENKSLGFYVQEEVSWNDRVFVTGAVRFDDNSAFGAEFEAETYPKFSATWVISEENFWNLDFMNSLRLRGAWGQAGRQPDVFAGTDIYSVIPGPSGTAALNPASPGNPLVGPETSTEIEVGFDMALLDDRISGEFTYYNQKTEDALLPVGIAPSLGFPGTRDQNLGRIDSWGWEAALNSRIYTGDSWGFDLRLSADHTDNEIKDLGNFGGTGSIAVGLPFPNTLNTFYVTSAEFDPSGAYSNSYGQRVSAMCDPGVSLAPSDAELPGQYGMVLGGDPVPCQTLSSQNILMGPAFFTYTFSVAPTLSMLNNSLQIFALAEGKYGKTGTANDVQWGFIYNNSRVSRAEDDPLWVAMDRMASFYGDNRSKGLFDADFWKLREIGARYQLPESLIGRVGMDRASLSVSGRNLFTLWRAQEEIFGLEVTDPEYGTPYIDTENNFWETPPLASFSATLRMSF